MGTGGSKEAGVRDVTSWSGVASAQFIVYGELNFPVGVKAASG